MTMTRILFCLFACAVVCLFPTVSRAQSIGELDNGNRRYIDGCGSPQIWPKGRGSYGGNGVFYVVPNNGGDGIVMNLDGRVINLRKEGTSSFPRNLRKGSTYARIYKGHGYTVRITYTVTKVNKDPDHGESYNY